MVQLVKLCAEDAFYLERLHARCFAKPWSEQSFIDVLATPVAFGLSAQKNGEILGFILTSITKPEAEILTLAVDPDHQRNQLGRQLVEIFEYEAKKRGVQRVFLDVAEDNRAALALYKKLNYKQAGRRQNYYTGAGQATDAILMTKAVY